MQAGTSRVRDRRRTGAGEGRRRVIIEGVKPEIDCGRFPIKRTVGEDVVVEADVFTDGHDTVACRLLWKHRSARTWRETPMEPLGNDRWRATFTADQLGRYQYTLDAWIDAFGTWRSDLRKRIAAEQDVSVDLLIGARLVASAAERARGRDRATLEQAAQRLGAADEDVVARTAFAIDDALATIVLRYPDRTHGTAYERILEVVVDPAIAGFSAWYELFPRSASSAPGRHGTLRDVEARLPYVKELGFDVLYLPPIHPIGESRRKGPNNAPEGAPGAIGSPWGIGSRHGGHKSVHPDLGTIEDVRRLAKSARAMGIELALDIAFQASPDHPYVQDHEDWFRKRPDGTIQYAENPPKKYQDIYPFDFDNERWAALWRELESVFLFWIEHGVRIFRVDNPHTKPFPFWEWLIARIKAKHPDVVLLSEAFTRPRIMYRLAKLGFTQSYTYFAWRNHGYELQEYLEELTQTDVVEYFRPNFWPNTPDILTEFLQTGGRPAFVQRIVLAATLSANYGIYGPAYELLEHRPREAGSEEYLDSEKYQIREWDLDRHDSLRHFIARLNRIRRDNRALHENRSLRFHRVDNPQILAYTKRTADLESVILTVVNLDPRHTHSGWVEVPIRELGIDDREAYEVHDLLSDARYTWHGAWNYVQLDPHVLPAHILRVHLPVRAPAD
jgi:starch synthase (maltosyl-transferring)